MPKTTPTKYTSQNAPSKSKAGSTSKLDQLAALISRTKGATLAELIEATGWQAHSVRGAIAGALRSKRRLNIASEKTKAGRTYRIVSGND